MRTGLFFVRAAEDLDDPPDLLVAADDRVELAGPRLGGEVAAVLLERLVGALGVRRWSRAGRRGRSGARRGSPRGRRRGARAAAGPRRRPRRSPSSRCSVEMYSSPSRRASSCGALDDALGARVEASASRPGSGRAARGSPASSPRKAGRSTPSRRSVSAGMPSSGSTSAASRCSASSDGALEPLGELLGGDDGLLGLLGESVELHGWSRARSWSVRWLRWWPGGRAGRRGRGTRFAAASAPRRRGSVGQDDADLHVQVAARRRPCRRGMPWPLSRNVRPVWVPAGIVSRTRPLSVATGTSAPSSASRERDRELALEVRARAREDRVRLDAVTVTTRSRPSGPLPDSRTRLPVSTPARDRAPRGACPRPRPAGSCRGTPPRG